MDAVNTIWENLKKLMIARNPTLGTEEIEQSFNVISANARFITGLTVQGQKFTVSVDGQAIGFELCYDPLLRAWKGTLKDALENVILSDITMLVRFSQYWNA